MIELFPVYIKGLIILVFFIVLVSVAFFLYFLGIYNKGKKLKKTDDNTLMFDVAYFWEIGKRPYQEDSYYISPLVETSKQGLTTVVADGMGGLQHGDVISKRVVDTIESWHPISFFAVDMTADSIRKLSNELYDEYKQEGGSTLAMVNIMDSYMHYYSVGDSNIILVRDGVSTILNQKQNYLKTLITSLVKQGRQTQAAYADNRARALTDFIGNHNPRVIYTSKPIRLFDGDTLIVCSDGVTDSVKFDSIHEMVENKASTTAFNIKQAVKSVKNPRQDNYTAVVIKVKRNMYD